MLLSVVTNYHHGVTEERESKDFHISGHAPYFLLNRLCGYDRSGACCMQSVLEVHILTKKIFYCLYDCQSNLLGGIRQTEVSV